jgi:thiamine-phosphate pyrophosphorylase
VDWVQLREKDLEGRALFELARQAVSAAGSQARVIVNDRLDVALAASAGGVHLGGQSLPIAPVVRWLAVRAAPRGFLIGASCHSLAEAQEAERSSADYLFFGPVFATPAKLSFGPPQGLDRLEEVCRAVRIPVLAIGGVTVENSGECLARGARGIAAIRLFQEARDLPAVVARLRAA